MATKKATAKVSKKGWIVIPKEIRDRHGIKPGDEVHLYDFDNRILVVPLMKDPIKELRGILKGGPSLTKALLEERRKEKEREERKLRGPTGARSS
jgi:AbrB family looped-hinge helix DNA binding protein